VEDILMELQDGVDCQSLCGQDSVLIVHRAPTMLNLMELKTRLEGCGQVRGNAALLRCALGSYEITVFADGRAVVKGTQNLSVALGIYAQYVGA
jgi:molybdopterin-synthase adenylyltransferase